MKKNGEVIDVLLSATAERDAQGNILRSRSFFIDVTEKKRAEKELRESEEKFSRAFQNSPDAVAIAKAVDGTLIDVNEAFIRMSGYSREEVIGRTAIELGLWSNPEDRDRYVAALKEKGRILGFEASFKTKLGEIRTCLVSGEFIVVQDKQCMLGVIHDITERKQTEEALRDSEANLRKAQEIGKIGSWAYGLSGPITWSDEMYRIYGVSPETFAPDPASFLSLIHPDDQSKMQAWINDCAAGEKPRELEFRTVPPDGTVRFISGRGELIYDSEGKPLLMAGTAHDITERKRAEQELQSVESRPNDAE